MTRTEIFKAIEEERERHQAKSSSAPRWKDSGDALGTALILLGDFVRLPHAPKNHRDFMLVQTAACLVAMLEEGRE